MNKVRVLAYSDNKSFVRLESQEGYVDFPVKLDDETFAMAQKLSEMLEVVCPSKLPIGDYNIRKHYLK